MNRSVNSSACPDWVALEATRDDGAGGEAAWMDALEHRQQCDACHEAALDVDPTLMFLDLPAVETSEAEIAAMQERVAISRRFSESLAEVSLAEVSLAEVSPAEVSAEDAGTADSNSGRASRWLAAAAALVFVGVAGLNQPFVTLADWNAPGAGPGSDVQTAVAPAAELDGAITSSLAEHLEALPLVEGGDVRYEVSGGSADYAVLVYTGVDL